MPESVIDRLPIRELRCGDNLELRCPLVAHYRLNAELIGLLRQTSVVDENCRIQDGGVCAEIDKLIEAEFEGFESFPGKRPNQLAIRIDPPTIEVAEHLDKIAIFYVLSIDQRQSRRIHRL